MRKNLLALATLAIVLTAMYLWMQANRSFKWVANFRPDSDEPYDCMIFDSIASATMPRGYTYWVHSFDSLMHVPGRKSLLIINNTWRWDSLAWLRIDSCVRQGNKVMIVLENGMEELQQQYKIYTSYDHSDTDALAMALKGHLPPDTLEWVGHDPLAVRIPQGVFSGWIYQKYDKRFKATAYVRSDTLWKQLARNPSWWGDDTVDMLEVLKKDGSLRMPISLAAREGSGWLYVSSTPLLFTNYGALDVHISKFLNRQMAQLADYPTYRLDSELFREDWKYSSDNNFSQSPLSYMLSRPPLRWALYTLLLAILLFMLFTARRRQRVIPVREPLVNRNLEFVRLLGTIYHRRHDNIDLLRKKYTYFKEEVRRRMMIDLDDRGQEETNARLLAQRTGLDESDVADLLRRLRHVVSLTAGDISSADLRNYIDQIENISKHL